MTMTLATVPMPGRLRSGIQASSTATPTTADAMPIVIPCLQRQPLMEHVPRVEPESGAHHHRHREAVAGQPEQQRAAAHRGATHGAGSGSVSARVSWRTRSASRSRNSAGMRSAGLKILPSGRASRDVQFVLMTR